MQDRYLPSTLEGMMAHLAEECAEVIKVLSKMNRFGVSNYHPVSGISNLMLLKEELADLEVAKTRLLERLKHTS